MMWTIIGGFFVLLWWLANRHLKDDFLPFIKYPALFFALIFICVDVFMFIETDRLINAHECCQESCNDTAACGQCCLSYNIYTTEYVDNITLVSGTLDHGDERSYDTEDDGDTYLTNATLNTTEIHYNFTGISDYSLVNVKMRSEYTQMQFDIWDGSNWTTAWSFGAEDGGWSENSFTPLNKYITDNTVVFRVYGDGMIPDEQYEGDVLTLSVARPIYMYCDSTGDTAAIFAYHFTEYTIIPVIVGLLPILAILVGGGLVIQMMWIVVKGARNENQGRGFSDDKEKPKK